MGEGGRLAPSCPEICPWGGAWGLGSVLAQRREQSSSESEKVSQETRRKPLATAPPYSSGCIQPPDRASSWATGPAVGPWAEPQMSIPVGSRPPPPLGARGMCQGAGQHWGRPSPPQELPQSQALRQCPAAAPARTSPASKNPVWTGRQTAWPCLLLWQLCPQQPVRRPYQLVSESPALHQAPRARGIGWPPSEVPRPGSRAERRGQ